jgi:hypothetical protein
MFAYDINRVSWVMFKATSAEISQKSRIESVKFVQPAQSPIYTASFGLLRSRYILESLADSKESLHCIRVTEEYKVGFFSSDVVGADEVDSLHPATNKIDAKRQNLLIVAFVIIISLSNL